MSFSNVNRCERGSFIRAAVFVGALFFCFGCEKNVIRQAAVKTVTNEVAATAKPQVISPIVAAARQQIGVTTVYDPAYVGLSYPGGDVQKERGVCTDVVIRALRKGAAMDLQQLVHEDMRVAFNSYPKNWGLKKTDKNIDHRRVPNLRRFFERRQFEVKPSEGSTAYQPGDFVTCPVGNRPHIMIVSDRKSADGTSLIIHNIGSGTKEENRLFEFELTGHYRFPGKTKPTKRD